MPTLESIDLSATAIEPNDPRYRSLLQDLQGDILKPNGRKFAAYIVFQFHGPVPAVRSWLASLATDYVTSAAKQFSDADAFRNHRVDGGLFGTLAISAAAYDFLGFPFDKIPRYRTGRFFAGMHDRTTQQILHNPLVECWEPWAQGPIHAVLSLFDNDPAALDKVVRDIQERAAGKANVHKEEGSRWRNDKDYFIEPFGFRDGISQPIFVKSDLPSGQPAGSYDPSAPLSLVLVHDPNGAGPYSHGSFLVYRKLKQDVAGFHKDVRALADKLRVDLSLAYAYVVGRFQDGTPVVRKETPSGDPDNSFQFDLDRDGTRCPFHAHIRKTNPRGDTFRSNHAPPDVERSQRIVRRAFSYGSEGGDNVGLQFFCYQSDIGHQFEFIQSAWSNEPNFLQMDPPTGLDPLIGQSKDNDTGAQQWPNAWGDASKGTTSYGFKRRVALQGGAYLFAPSISFLKSLAET
jgi:Dyp-type peroxidase family